MASEYLFQAKRPDFPLYPYIGVIWYMKGPPFLHPCERLLPTATVEVVINLGEPFNLICNPLRERTLHRYDGAVVCGPQSGHFTIDTNTERHLVGIHFRPGGLTPFSPLPLSEMRDWHLSIEDIWGDEGRRLHHRLLESSPTVERFRLVEEFFLSQWNPTKINPAIESARNLFVSMGPQARVAPVVDHIGFSRRHFNRLFQSSLGMPAKAFCRISRFQHALRKLEVDPHPDWSSFALDFGFYDQAHMINEFKSLSGFSPELYLANRGTRLNHIPLRE
ncbi:AraC family transcriptional regulator [Sulfidibacter corallicola]|uniref:AraC family transcriptional regulator n=1 Tax=Sulfidibacter corallicola TaxID=2818388 RepID=A0A8A4TI37_SULCO|nr:helix-turn-helix domain-containing protein [Sulfidibacter corallicola]QTD49157.1 AraC family transcriptional regulator [Sulfidibacter corallicola]